MSVTPIFRGDPRGPAADRRREPRRRVLLQGKVVFPHNSFSADCMIRDLSERGARIAVADQMITTHPFLIVVREAVIHQSTTMWTDPRQAGLRFDESHALDGEVPLRLRAMRRLWVDLAPR